MASRPRRQLYCRCGTLVAKDNTERQCARCQRASRDKLITPPEVPAEFWQTDQFRDAFAAQHMGRMPVPTAHTRTTTPSTDRAASPKVCWGSGWD